MDVLFVKLKAYCMPELNQNILCTDKDKTTDEHTSSDTNISNDAMFNVLMMVDVKHELGSDVRRSHVLFEVEFFLFSKLKIVHVLQKLLDMLLLQALFSIWLWHPFCWFFTLLFLCPLISFVHLISF